MARLTLSIADGIARVELARPERLNALDGRAMAQLVEAGDAIAARRDVRVVVLSGAGRAFCAGIDLDSLKRLSGTGEADVDLTTPVRGAANLAQLAVLQWRDLPVPVIAAVHGVALGAGLQLALGADIRIVAPDALLAIAEARWGLVPDMAGFATLVAVLPRDQIARLAFAGEEIDGVEAARIGLATELAEDPLARALALARTIAGNNPSAVRAAKRLMAITDEAEQLRAEAAAQLALFGTPNQREAVAARLEKRAPVFTDDT
ncbi:crotonase/enoyl-CoA hydratase family protein [Sphingomonas sp. CGMCC 1.13654]|uniref:Crotonase/enoyl-CoA hydratase family protein n=1 Tax=Sphingomonas chungangi TaxID=2683589 RepID=A0A838L2Z0_9SPHN|nr:crotonase/enoyl-CoA hydratase family protein [Sphingomonas chungangi]MBA2933863.1 crotonase/enoyl-CoA hydratase family protein [Sphingomonas chungangi]MVW55193.1 crotonase/enoyl-CoA hydratase family protein [Sphingomonas chungangi]